MLDMVSLPGAVNTVAELWPLPAVLTMPCDRVSGWGCDAISVVVPWLAEDVTGKRVVVEVRGLLYVTDCVRAGNT
jgi:hypothetical protein